jgi:sec-independent protein translocase protein TatA
MNLAIFEQLGFSELIIILLIILLLFGAKKLPDLARSLGKSIGEFKKGKDEYDHDSKKPTDNEKKPPQE